MPKADLCSAACESSAGRDRGLGEVSRKHEEVKLRRSASAKKRKLNYDFEASRHADEVIENATVLLQLLTAASGTKRRFVATH
jgi:hypothetical protein